MRGCAAGVEVRVGEVPEQEEAEHEEDEGDGTGDGDEPLLHVHWMIHQLSCRTRICDKYHRDGLKGGPVLLSNSQADISRNLGPTF